MLEVVLASLLFATLVTLLSSIWVVHARAQSKAAHLLVAADLADLEMERAIDAGFYGVTPSTGSYTQIWKVRGEEIPYRFNTEVKVTPLTKNADPSLAAKRVVVKVSYSDGIPNTPPRTFTVESVIVDAG